MKIVFYHTEHNAANLETIYTRGTSGTVSTLLWVAKGLAELGHDVHVLSFSEDIVVNGVKFVSVNSQSGAISYLENLPNIDAFIAIAGAGQIFEEYNCNARIRIYWLHVLGMWNNTLFLKALKESRLDKIVCVSAFHLSYLLFGLEKHALYRYKMSLINKLSYIYNPINLNYISKFRKGVERNRTEGHGSKFIICFAGMLASYKGFHHVVRVFFKFNKLYPNSELRVFGSSELYGITETVGRSGYVEKEFEEEFLSPYLFPDGKNIHPDIKFFGTLARKELYSEMAGSSVLVTGLDGGETFCVTVAEAQALGVPVVTRQRGGQSELIVNSKSGYVVKMDDEKLIAALGSLYSMEDDRFREMQKTAVKNIERFDYKVVSQEWELFIFSLLNNKGFVDFNKLIGSLSVKLKLIKD
ncbi:glycosyltransferase family 4 protein [Rufibacter soli]